MSHFSALMPAMTPPLIRTALLSFLLSTLSPLSFSAQPCLILPPYNRITVAKVSFRDPTHAQTVRINLHRICTLQLLNPDRGYSPSADILLLTAAQLRYLRSTLPSTAVTLLDPDLGASIRREAALLAPYPRPLQLDISRPRVLPSDARIVNDEFYTKFHVYDDFVDYWHRLNTTFASLRLETIGTTVEKRPIHALRIGRTSHSKPVRVLFNALQHAREWVSVQAAVYAAEAFAVAAAADGGDPLARKLRKVEVIVIPMVNPDGYVHTHNVDRLWRKNRQEEVCVIGRRRFASAGVDLNRNWGVDFGGNQSTSTDPCEGVYSGREAFSAPETAAVRDFVLRTPGIVAHVDIHSYSQLVIGPWLYTQEEPRNASEIDKVGEMLAKDLSSEGREYTYGRGANNGMYLASGTMMDWFFARGVMSFTFELRPDKKSFVGFELNEEQILPTCREVFKALTRMVAYSYSPNLSKLEGAAARRMGRIFGYVVAGVAFAAVLIAFAVVIGYVIVQRRKGWPQEEQYETSVYR